jgi:two-component system sensor histidine kinase RegB
LFIAKTLIERSGAQLVLANAEPNGAAVRIAWPRAAFERGAASFPDTGAPIALTNAQSLPI